MSSSSEQNGRQTTPHQQSSAPKDPRPRKGLPSSTAICRDFMWGICMKGARCRHRHELEYNSMRATLKFCHIYQNRGVCNWPDCTYLHATRDEENLFMNTGQIPRVLADRYAAMSVYEYMAAPPPPPPPLPPAPPVSVPASDVVRFDPSRPPPPLPRKRSSDSTEAGTSNKIRKVESPDILCNNCTQRKLRTEVYKQEMEKMEEEEERKRMSLKKKIDDFQKGKLLLRSILSPKWYCILDNYIESTNQGNSLFSQSSFVSKTSTVPRQFWLQLVKHVLGSPNSSNILESAQSTSRESSLLESLSGLSRQNSATSSSSPDTLHALLDALRPSDRDQQVPPGRGPMPAPAPFVPSSVSAGPLPPPARAFYAQPYPPPVPPMASAPQSATQTQPYYAHQYAGLGSPAAQYAAAAPPYPIGGSVVAPHYPPTGADSSTSQQMHLRNNQYSGSYPSY